MTSAHLASLEEELKNPANEWLSVSLQPVLETDENGLITMFQPTQSVSMGLVFFFQNLMVQQRLFLIDKFLKEQGQIV